MTDENKLEGLLAGTANSTSSKKRQPKLDFHKNDPIIQSVISKLSQNEDKPPAFQYANGRGDTPIETPSDALIQKISQKTAGSVTDAKSMYQVLPDTELASQILVSSILSPNDMVKTDLFFTLEDESFLPELTAPMLSVIEHHFTNEYNIKGKLATMLEDMLFLKGSYPMAILPESSIDAAINSPNRVNLESISDVWDSKNDKLHNIGLLGNPNGQSTTTISFESYKVEPEYDATVKLPKVTSMEGIGILSVLDNPNLLKLPTLQEKIKQHKVRDLLSVNKINMEGRDTKAAEQIADGMKRADSAYFRRRNFQQQPVLRIYKPEDLDKESVGHPLVMNLPAESMIPVHVPSSPSEHIGYFILMDMIGNPITMSGSIDHYSDLSSAVHRNKNLSSTLISNSRALSEDQTEQQLDIEEAVNSYIDIVEGDLRRRLAAGIYGDNVDIARPQEVYRLMLARAAKAMNTQMLYVPAELVSYMAFDYNDYGVGVSLMEKSKIIGGIRSMLMFASTMGGMKNSIGRTGLNIELDPEDPNPQKTVEFLMHEYAKTRQASYPLGTTSPNDIINYLQNAAIDVSVSGNTLYPETKVDVEDRSGNVANIDTDLEEDMKNRHIMSFGLSPDMLESAKSEDFATSFVTRSLLLAKRVSRYQDIFNEGITDFVVKYTLNSQPLIDSLKDKIEANKDLLSKEHKGDVVEKLIMAFLNALRVRLPSADATTLEGQMEQYEEYVDAVDSVLEVIIDDAYITDAFAGEATAENIDEIRGMVGAMLKRQFLRANNIMTEVTNLTVMDKDNKTPLVNLMEIFKSHADALGKSTEEFILDRAKTIRKRDAKFQEKMDKLDNEEEEDNDQNDTVGNTNDGSGDTPPDDGGSPTSDSDDIADSDDSDSTDTDVVEEPEEEDVEPATDDESTEPGEEEDTDPELDEDTDTDKDTEQQ